MGYGIWTHTYCGPTMVVSHCVKTSDTERENCVGVVSPVHNASGVLGPWKTWCTEKGILGHTYSGLTMVVSLRVQPLRGEPRAQHH